MYELRTKDGTCVLDLGGSFAENAIKNLLMKGKLIITYRTIKGKRYQIHTMNDHMKLKVTEDLTIWLLEGSYFKKEIIKKI